MGPETVGSVWYSTGVGIVHGGGEEDEEPMEGRNDETPSRTLIDDNSNPMVEAELAPDITEVVYDEVERVLRNRGGARSDVENPASIPTAEVVTRERNACGIKWTPLIIGLSIFTLVVLLAKTIGVMIGVSSPSGSLEPESTAEPTPLVPTDPPTDPPTGPPQSPLYEYLLELLIPDKASDIGPPQYQALHWLAYDDEAGDLDSDPDVLRERYAMAVLYYSTAGDDWSDNRIWLSNASICEWVADYPGHDNCIGESRSFLYLPGNNLKGTIPTEIGLLSALTVLLMGDNDLRGTIPTEIGSLIALTSLSLRDNEFSGTKPSGLRTLTTLKGLWLNDNDLRGTIPTEIGTLTSLIELTLDDNYLNGTIPSGLATLTALTYLNFKNNDLNGTIPTEIGSLTNLNFLWLGTNAIIGPIPPELGLLTHLTDLKLYSNELTGTIPTELGQLTKLTDLPLWENNLEGTIPTEIGMLTRLISLDFSENVLTGNIPSELSSLTALTELYLSYNELSGRVPSELNNLSLLSGVGLSRNQLTGGLENLFCGLENIYFSADCISELECNCCSVCY